MSSDLLAILIKANLASAAAILLVAALRKPARRVFGAHIAYKLWLMVPLAVAAGLLPARTVVLPYVEALETSAPLDATVGGAVATAVIGSASLDIGVVAAGLWLAGAVASLAILAWRQTRFMSSLGGVVRDGRFLRAKTPGLGPAVVGAFSPRIILPADFETRYDEGEQKVVIAHEASHVASGDMVVNAIVALTQCLFWFNPLIHMAARALRIDQELACDAAVLKTHPQMRLVYARALLKTQVGAAPLPVGCYWPAAGQNPLKERIAMLMIESPSPAARLAGGASVLALCLGAGAAAWAAQPATVTLEPRSAADAAPPVAAWADAKPRPAAIQTAQAATLPAPAAATANTSSARTVVGATPSAAGNTYERIDADLIPARAYPLSVIMPDGRQKPVITPRIIPMLLPREETEDYRAARRVYDAAREEHAARVASGRPPQPWTPELQSAIDTLDAFARDLIAKRVANREAYYETITVTAEEGGVPTVAVSSTASARAAWPYSTSYMVPRNFTTDAKTRALATLDALLAEAPPRRRELLVKMRAVVAQKPTTN